MNRNQYLTAERMIESLLALIDRVMPSASTTIPSADIILEGVRLRLRGHRVDSEDISKGYLFTALLLVGDTHVLEPHEYLRTRAYVVGEHAGPHAALIELASALIQKHPDGPPAAPVPVDPTTPVGRALAATPLRSSGDLQARVADRNLPPAKRRR